jgi:hypothetical protein
MRKIRELLANFIFNNSLALFRRLILAGNYCFNKYVTIDKPVRSKAFFIAGDICYWFGYEIIVLGARVASKCNPY